MMFEDMIASFAGWLAGGASEPPSSPRQQNDAASDLLDRGWLPWASPYQRVFDGSVHGQSPYDWPRVWIWRPEWTGLPREVEPTKLAPEMNVIGLWWKPWAKDFDQSPIPALHKPEGKGKDNG